jgi:hypothetical protein
MQCSMAKPFGVHLNLEFSCSETVQINVRARLIYAPDCRVLAGPVDLSLGTQNKGRVRSKFPDFNDGIHGR